MNPGHPDKKARIYRIPLLRAENRKQFTPCYDPVTGADTHSHTTFVQKIAAQQLVHFVRTSTCNTQLPPVYLLLLCFAQCMRNGRKDVKFCSTTKKLSAESARACATFTTQRHTVGMRFFSGIHRRRNTMKHRQKHAFRRNIFHFIEDNIFPLMRFDLKLLYLILQP